MKASHILSVLAATLAAAHSRAQSITNYSFTGQISTQTHGGTYSDPFTGNGYSTSSWSPFGQVVCSATAEGVTTMDGETFRSAAETKITNYRTADGSHVNYALIEASVSFDVAPDTYYFNAQSMGAINLPGNITFRTRLWTSHAGTILYIPNAHGQSNNLDFSWSGHLEGSVALTYTVWLSDQWGPDNSVFGDLNAAYYFSTQPVPEPSTLIAVACGLSLLRRRGLRRGRSLDE
jgi:hypothetical protein